MKFSELKDRAVVDLGSARKIGNLDSLVLNPDSHQPVGLKVKNGLFSSAEMVPLSQVQNVGQDAITVSTPASAATAKSSANPMKDLPDLASVVGHQVVTQSGKLLGSISDVVLDQTSLSIVAYEVSPGGLFAKKHDLPVSPDLNFGTQILIVPDQTATTVGLG